MVGSIYTALGGGGLAWISAANFASREVTPRPEKWDEINPMELHGAKLAQSNLAHLNARLAFLVHADMHGSELQFANFTDSDLRGANLSGTVLTGAVFKNAKLKDAQFYAARFRFSDIKLEEGACSDRSFNSGIFSTH